MSNVVDVGLDDPRSVVGRLQHVSQSLVGHFDDFHMLGIVRSDVVLCQMDGLAVNLVNQQRNRDGLRRDTNVLGGGAGLSRPAVALLSADTDLMSIQMAECIATDHQIRAESGLLRLLRWLVDYEG